MPAVRRQLRGFDLKQIRGHDSLIGVDEAGRGALAGPVVAAAVLVTQKFLEDRWAQTKASQVNDSKLLTPAQRETLYEEIDQLCQGGALFATLGTASAAEIEEHNILGATKLAMRRALEQLHPPEAFYKREEPDLFSSLETREHFQPRVNCRILIDGLPLRSFPYPHTALVKGDGRSLSIALASIVAKVSRDRLLDALERDYPGYGFSRHKGYGTEEHRKAVLALGPCLEHREAFLRNLRAGHSDPYQMDFLDD